MRALIRKQQGDRTYVAPLITGRDGDNGAVSGAFEMAYSGSRGDHTEKRSGEYGSGRGSPGDPLLTHSSLSFRWPPRTHPHTVSHNVLYLKHTDSTAFPL